MGRRYGTELKIWVAILEKGCDAIGCLLSINQSLSQVWAEELFVFGRIRGRGVKRLSSQAHTIILAVRMTMSCSNAYSMRGRLGS
jgi:hypothetical protein